MESGKTVDGRDLSEDGKILDDATSSRIPNTLVKRNENNFADVTVSTANKLTTPRKITFQGAVSGALMFDGSEDVKVNLTQVDTDGNEYYTKAEFDEILKNPSNFRTEQAILSNGQGIAPFSYDGRENVTVRAAFAGIQGDYGVNEKYVARSDHRHDLIYYTKDEVDTGKAFEFGLRVAGNKLQLTNKDVLLTEVALPSLI